jgi:hypothetical protein
MAADKVITRRSAAVGRVIFDGASVIGPHSGITVDTDRRVRRRLWDEAGRPPSRPYLPTAGA